MYKKLITAFLLILSQCTLAQQGFVHTEGTAIVDGNGDNLLLRGMGLGGWLAPEGYMLKTSGFADAPWEIRNHIESLIGTAAADEFYELYESNYVARKDIEQLAAWGFNSVRLPFHYKALSPEGEHGVYLEEGFAVFDSLIAWCRDNDMYVILDMHAAPGGQSDENISDYNPSKPALWESEANKTHTVMIWHEIARRYHDEPVIAGYDLINEPKWPLGDDNKPLRDLYIRLTDTIRIVDNNHIIFVEGNWFATDFSGLTPPWDDNMVYSFHKYWNETDVGTINYLLSMRTQTDTPLWLGETGENSNAWFTETVMLMEQNNIGWAWWPHKKVDNIAGPLSSTRSEEYQRVLDYWENGTTLPSAQYAIDALMGMAADLAIDSCRFQPDVIDALMRAPYETTTFPYKLQKVPGTIYAVNFDMGRHLFAYKDSEYKNTGGGVYNNGWAYRNDGVDIEPCTDTKTNGYNVGWIAHQEWLAYTVQVEAAGEYSAHIRYAANAAGGEILLRVNGIPVSDFIQLPVTGGWQNWQTVTVDGIALEEGERQIKVSFYNGGFNLNYLEFDLITGVEDEETTQPESFGLYQNYPNPFNGDTVVRYTVGERSEVTIAIYDVQGKLVASLLNKEQMPGSYEVRWNGTNNAGAAVPTGIYLARMRAGEFTTHRKMVLLK